MMEDVIRTGTLVRLIGQAWRTYVVASHEMHNDIVFYRLIELPGALFLRSSLEEVG